MALVDANYKFIAVDIGQNGRNSDSGVFNNWVLEEALASGLLNIPDGKQLLHNRRFQNGHPSAICHVVLHKICMWPN